MTKKMINLIVMAIVLIIGILLYSNKTYAATTVDGIMQGAQSFLEEGEDATHSAGANNVVGGSLDETELKNTSNFLFNLLLSIAMVVAVIVGMVIGIQFMVASVEEKAKIKEMLVPYVAGCVVIFGAFGIWKLAVTILSLW